MSDPFKKVAPGDRLEISAPAYNAFVDAALAHRNNQHNVRIDRLPEKSTGAVLIRNDSGSVRQRFDVLGIAGPLIAPANNLTEFQNRVALKGVAPAAATVAAGRIAILAEPLKAGKIGRAFVHGVCAARVKILDPNHVCAVAMAGVADHLESAAEGPIQIIWNEPVAPGAVAWSLIRFGGGGGSYETWVRVKKTAGDWGTATTRCSWVYDLYPTTGEMDEDTRLVAGVSSVYGRASAGRYHAAAYGSVAIAVIDPDGDPEDPGAWMLIAVDEVEDVAVCNAAAP
ncbi:hypothetical protein LLG95_12880 [bacterium]|nr:hypothetical protein [bacterium]